MPAFGVLIRNQPTQVSKYVQTNEIRGAIQIFNFQLSIFNLIKLLVLSSYLLLHISFHHQALRGNSGRRVDGDHVHALRQAAYVERRRQAVVLLL